jgi:hypothetical protein
MAVSKVATAKLMIENRGKNAMLLLVLVIQSLLGRHRRVARPCSRPWEAINNRATSGLLRSKTRYRPLPCLLSPACDLASPFASGADAEALTSSAAAMAEDSCFVSTAIFDSSVMDARLVE